MEFKQKDLLLIYVIVAVVSVGLVLKVVFFPFHEKLKSTGDAVVLQEARLKKSISLVEKKDFIRKEYDEYASYFSLQDSSDESAKASFLKEIEKISREGGLAIVDMKPQKEVVNEKFAKEYQINIKAEATMKELVNFLYSLRTSSLLFSVEKMVLLPKSEESSELNITMTIIGVVFS